jgi:hypothetical protein
MPWKKYKVEDLMKEILKKLQLLYTSWFFKSENEQKNERMLKELETAINQLSELPSSLPEDEGRYSHYRSGAMFINPGLGTQHNYSQSGTSNSHQYIDLWKDVLLIPVLIKRLNLPSFNLRMPLLQRFGPVLTRRLERPVGLGPATSDSESYGRYVFDAHKGTESRHL